jgi:hypothetical protein
MLTIEIRRKPERIAALSSVEGKEAWGIGCAELIGDVRDVCVPRMAISCALILLYLCDFSLSHALIQRRHAAMVLGVNFIPNRPGIVTCERIERNASPCPNSIYAHIDTVHKIATTFSKSSDGLQALSLRSSP